MNHTKPTAKVFWADGAQAVRLPREFRFEGNAVRIRREGQAVVLEPLEAPEQAEDGWGWLRNFSGGPLDEDFVKAALEEWPQQERPELDDL